MKSTSELTDYYYTHLYDALEALERDRLKVRNRVLLLLGGIAAVLAVAAIVPLLREYIVWLVFGAFILGGFGYNRLIRNYRSDFKEKIIRPLVAAIDPGLLYAPANAVPRTLFESSHLFDTRIDRYRGNDYVEGTLEGIPVRFSDIHAEHRSQDQKGNNQWNTVFRGLFIVADFNKHLKGRTVVLPDLAENLLGSYLGNLFQSKNFSRDSLVRMDDPEFEKAFVVYGTDQIEARYILTHSMMKRLLELKKRTGKDLYVSFNGEKIMIAIAYDKDLFEPTVFHSLLSVKQATEYINTLRSAIGIVGELKLNEKLWSKT